MVANLPYVADGELDSLAPEIRLFEPREALISGPDGLDSIRALLEEAPSGAAVALEHAPHQGEAVRGAARRGPHPPRPRRPRAGYDRSGAVTPEEADGFGRCIAEGGVVLFPSDTVYGLAIDPESRMECGGSTTSRAVRPTGRQR